jgi:hypothetical protein
MLLALLAALAAVAFVATGCGSGTSAGSKTPPTSPHAAGAATTPGSPHSASSVSPTCPLGWKPGWQRLADQIAAPVYCPSWLPQPLTGRIGGYGSGKYVEPDRSYLVTFFYIDTTGASGEEVHVNFRGYPGRVAIPVCEDTVTANGKTSHPKIPCFADSRGQKQFGPNRVTVFTANQGADEWHVLYAWHHAGSLYTVSEHVAPPYSYPQVVENLNRMMRGLVLLTPLTEEGGRLK